MKKTLLVMMALLLGLSLCACAKKDEVTVCTVEWGDVAYTVDKENGTISDGENIYHYEMESLGSGGWKLMVTYPDGSTYGWEESGNFGTGRCSVDFEYGKYPDAAALANVLKAAQPERMRSGNPALGLLFLAVGLFNTVVPEKSWYLSRGWYYKNAEPSSAALFLYRAGGILAVVVGVLLFFLG